MVDAFDCKDESDGHYCRVNDPERYCGVITAVEDNQVLVGSWFSDEKFAEFARTRLGHEISYSTYSDHSVDSGGDVSWSTGICRWYDVSGEPVVVPIEFGSALDIASYDALIAQKKQVLAKQPQYKSPRELYQFPESDEVVL